MTRVIVKLSLKMWMSAYRFCSNLWNLVGGNFQGNKSCLSQKREIKVFHSKFSKNREVQVSRKYVNHKTGKYTCRENFM